MRVNFRTPAWPFILCVLAFVFGLEKFPYFMLGYCLSEIVMGVRIQHIKDCLGRREWKS